MTTGQIKKAVIPAAGLGTRFFPATKTIPKEMLPIVDKPAILYVIEEAIAAGIEDIVLIQGRNKTAIEDFFDISYELEQKLIADGKAQMVEELNQIRNKANIISVRQKVALGLGHAVFTAKPVVGDEPFAVLLGDEISYSPSAEVNPITCLKREFSQLGISGVTVMEVPKEDVSKYGVIKFEALHGDVMKVSGLVEKPSPSEAPSNLALPGRYVFTKDIFSFLENAKPGKNGEIQLTDAMNQLAQKHGLFAIMNKSLRYDTGDKLGYLHANIEFALRRPDMGPAVKEMLKNYSL